MSYQQTEDYNDRDFDQDENFDDDFNTDFDETSYTDRNS
jgi:hypothetical protein